MENNNSKTLSIVRQINFISVLSIIFFLPLFINVGMRILLVLMVFTFIIETIAEKRWRNIHFKGNRYAIFFIALLSFFFLQYLFLPFEENFTFFFKITEERLSFLIIGLIGLIGLNSKFKLKSFAWAYVIASVFYCVFLLSHITREMLYSDDLFTQLGLIRVKYLNSHMKFNFHLNVTLVFVYYLLNSMRPDNDVRSKLVLYPAGFIILLTLWLSDGRTGTVTSLILLVMIFLHFLWGKNKYISIGVVVVVGVLFSAFVVHNSRFSVEFLKKEPRIQIWHVALQELKIAGIKGEGASTAWYNLNNDLLAVGLNNKHAHNILIQTTIEYGIVGLINLIVIFLSAYIPVSKNFRFIMLLILLAAFFQLMFGVFMRDVDPVGFLLPLLLIINEDAKKTSGTDLALKPDM